jgi:truncated hemoglobin YjbI
MPTLFEKIGGHEVISRVVAHFYYNIISDDIINHFFFDNVSDIVRLHTTM